MTNDNNKINELVSEQDEDPTVEIEPLSEEACVELGSGQQIEAESDANTFDFDQLGSDVEDADATIAQLKLDLRSRAESISKLQFDVEQLRSRWTGLEKEVKVREEITNTLTGELNLAHRKHSTTENLLRKREDEIEILTSKLSGQEQSLEDFARQIEHAGKNEQESESRVKEIQSRLSAAGDKLAVLTKDNLAGRSEQQETSIRIKSLTGEVDDLQTELAASRSSLSGLQMYIDRRNADWEKQQAQIGDNRDRIDQLTTELADASMTLRDSGGDFEEMASSLASIGAERDELLRKSMHRWQGAWDSDRAEKVQQVLAGSNFEINELNSQIRRTETYADELRRQLQGQLALTGELQSRQKHLEVSLVGANSQIEELSDGIERLRSSDQTLRTKNASLKREFDKEVRLIHLELGDAQETIVDRELLNEKLTTDLIYTRESNMKLEDRLGATEEQNKTTIIRLKSKLADIEILNAELQRKLSTKENAISVLLGELTKRSETIETIDEIEEVVDDLDDDFAESLDDRSSTERERITRLLVGKIDGQKLRFPLFKNRLTIGRTGHNDIQLKAPFISRRHAVIVTDDDITRIVDWGSKNGVFVNTTRIKEQILRNGDVVTIGTADFKFEERRKR